MSKSDVFHLGLTKNDLQGRLSWHLTVNSPPGARSWTVKQ